MLKGKISVCVILTCHNRRNMTVRCVETLNDENLDIRYLIVDDGSTDGTEEALNALAERKKIDVEIIKGSGNLFWAGGMRFGMERLLEKKEKYDYVVLVNDDVEFENEILHRMIEYSRNKNNAVITGATRWRGKNKGSYGGVVYDFKRAVPRQIDINDADKVKCDTMNCNCVLLPFDFFQKAGAFDSHYTHSMADYDYGFKLVKMGYDIYLTDFYAGQCDDNSSEGTWRDARLSRIERIRKKESPKGLPFKEWFYYLNKNFGIRVAIWHSLTPYIRIAIGK